MDQIGGSAGCGRKHWRCAAGERHPDLARGSRKLVATPRRHPHRTGVKSVTRFPEKIGSKYVGMEGNPEPWHFSRVHPMWWDDYYENSSDSKDGTTNYFDDRKWHEERQKKGSKRTWLHERWGGSMAEDLDSQRNSQRQASRDVESQSIAALKSFADYARGTCCKYLIVKE